MTGRSRTIPFAAVMVAAAVLLLGLSVGALAQDARGLLAPGDAAVTGFSGALPPIQLAPGIDPAEKTFIDLDGPSLEVFDLQDLRGPARAQLVRTPKSFSAKASQIGQVFGVTLDSASPPNIYVAASSAYGLPIVVGRVGRRTGPCPQGAGRARSSCPGLWGAAAPEGGPGSIWKIDGASGAVSLFANVGYEGRKNSGPALGGLAFDPQSQSLYAADRETGFIHRFGPDGAERGRYDHGVTGREAMAMKPVPFDPSRALDVASPPFDSADPATWNYAPPQRLVFGLAVAARRLYYSVAADQQIWSVGLAPDGAFMADPRPEIVVPPAAGPTEISKIAFDEQGRMFLAERPAPTGAFDFVGLSREGVGRVLRYERFVPPGGPPQWRPLPEDYAIGFPRQLNNANGGVAISYRYDSRGRIDGHSCGGFLWATGEDLRASADPALAARLRDWGPEHVQGLQGVESWRIRRDDEPPVHAYFTDYDDHFDDFSARGHMGDIAIFRTCGLAENWGADVWGESGGGAPPLFGFPPGGPKGPPKPPPTRKCTLLGPCPPPPPSGCAAPPVRRRRAGPTSGADATASASRFPVPRPARWSAAIAASQASWRRRPAPIALPARYRWARAIPAARPRRSIPPTASAPAVRDKSSMASASRERRTIQARRNASPARRRPAAAPAMSRPEISVACPGRRPPMGPAARSVKRPWATRASRSISRRPVPLAAPPARPRS